MENHGMPTARTDRAYGHPYPSYGTLRGGGGTGNRRGRARQLRLESETRLRATPGFTRLCGRGEWQCRMDSTRDLAPGKVRGVRARRRRAPSLRLARALTTGWLRRVQPVRPERAGSRPRFCTGGSCDPPSRTRSSARTRSRATRRASGMSAAPATRASRASPTDISVNHGETVDFKIDTDSTGVSHRHLPDGLLRRRRRAQGRHGHTRRRACRRRSPPVSTTPTTG